MAVIDVGSYTTKIGLAQGATPAYTPQSILCPREHAFGNPSYHLSQETKRLNKLDQMLQVAARSQFGIVTHQDIKPQIIENIFYSAFTDFKPVSNEMDETGTVLAKPELLAPKLEEKILEVFFEGRCAKAPIYIADQSLLSLFSTGRVNGIVLQCGHGSTKVQGFQDGLLIPKCSEKSPISGEEITNYLAKLCIENFSCVSHYSDDFSYDRDIAKTVLSQFLKRQFTYLEAQEHLEPLNPYTVFEPNTMTYSNLKKEICFLKDISHYRDENLEPFSSNYGKNFKLPDGNIFSVTTEASACCEPLFSPSLMGLTGDGLHEAIYKVIFHCPPDLKSTLINNVVLAGGTTMIKGLCDRLKYEMFLLNEKQSSIFIVNEEEKERMKRGIASWIGGSVILRNSTAFNHLSISLETYQEEGPTRALLKARGRSTKKL